VTIRLLVADDQRIVRAAFVNLLSAQHDMEVVGDAEDGLEAVRIAAMQRPDVALLDIRMPNLDGIEAAKRILQDNPEAKALMLTTFDLDEYVYRALTVGASGVPSQGRHCRGAPQRGAGGGARRRAASPGGDQTPGLRVRQAAAGPVTVARARAARADRTRD
jgi:CheY-like chemotaxis protein